MIKSKQILLIIALCALVCGACTSPLTEGSKRLKQKPHYGEAKALLNKMTLREKIGQLNQYSGEGIVTGPQGEKIDRREQTRNGEVGSFLNVTGAKRTRELQKVSLESRLGIPLLFGVDVIHGWRTSFPLPLAEAASFDLDQIELSARCAAIESTASGIHWTFAPMVDISWDPRWGRVMEGAGEDPYLGSLVAVARVKGLQGSDLSQDNTMLACVKHFAAYGASIAGKDYNSVDMSQGHFANYYMPPYKAAMDAGAVTFMSAFNDFNNIPSTGNKFLLRDLLKDRWGFTGFVVSDYNSVVEMVSHGTAADERQAAKIAITAGLDMEMVSDTYIDNLEKLVRSKEVDEKLIDDAVLRILIAKYELGLFDDPFRYCDEEREKNDMESPAIREASLKMAEKSIVLLKNETGLLPLSKNVKSVALIGEVNKLKRDMCGMWAGSPNLNSVVTVYDAMVERGIRVNFSEGYDYQTGKMKSLNHALEQARKSDVVVVSIGERYNDSGEDRSRSNIEVSADQQRLVIELINSGKPVVVLLMCGRPVIFNEVGESAKSILLTWWLGSQAGNAICNTLWGEHNPSGKLPMTFPRDVGQIPIYYNYKSCGRPRDSGAPWTVRYTDIVDTPAYPFGHGLSYAQFEYGDIEMSKKTMTSDGEITLSVVVSNKSSYDGEEVVQLYIRDLVASVTRPVKELKAFRKVMIGAGESKRVEFRITLDMLKYYDNDINLIYEPGEFNVMVGTNSDDLKSEIFTLL